MHEPQKPSEMLSAFPSVIWASISVFLSTVDMKNLKMTGTKLIWLRLATLNTVKTIMQGTTHTSFPAHLDTLPSIEELSINLRKSNPAQSSVLVPITVRKRTDSMKSDRCPSIPNEFHLCIKSRVPRIDEIHLQLQWSDERNWLRDIPPSLTKLTCSTWDVSSPLPTSLIDLNTTTIIVSKDRTSYKMPSSLEHLKTTYITDFELLLPLLPAGLKTFEEKGIFFNSSPQISEEDFSKLPKSLTKLVLQRYLPTGSDLSNLPNLVDLSISELPINGWTYLPDSITRLELLYGELLYIDFETIPSLNSNVSHIVNPLPPNLTYLRLENAQLSSQSVKRLPPSLKSLYITHLDPTTCKHLPRGITSLEVENTIANDEFIQSLPPGLTSLNLTAAAPGSRWMGMSEAIVHLETYEKQLAGPNQKHLSRWSGQVPLPSHLISLRLQGFSCVLSYEKLQALQFLELGVASPSLDDFVIPNLSRCLTIIRFPYSNDITSKSFVDLPAGLIELGLWTSVDVFDDDIQHLPRSLEILHMPKAIHLTNACISNLPQSLKEMKISRNELITADVFWKLPAPLRYVNARFPFVAANWKVHCGKIKGK